MRNEYHGSDPRTAGVLLPPEAHLLRARLCAAGHVKKGPGLCKTCRASSRRAHRPVKTRPCRDCGTIFSGSRRPICPDCAEKRDAQDQAAELAASHRPIRTRTCHECGESRPLDEFLLSNLRTQADRKGTRQYADCCTACRSDVVVEDDEEIDDQSPYAVARRQVEHIFGLPSSQWLNVRGHPLSLLHYSRMLAIHNAQARRVGGALLRPDRVVPIRAMWSLIVQARLTKRLRVRFAVAA